MMTLVFVLNEWAASLGALAGLNVALCICMMHGFGISYKFFLVIEYPNVLLIFNFRIGASYLMSVCG